MTKRVDPNDRQQTWDAEKADRRVYARDQSWAAEPIRRLIESCHPMQRDAVLDPARRVSTCIPRGGSKTTTFMVRALITMTQRVEAYVPFIATTKGHATNILWRKVKRAMEAVRIEYRPYEVDKQIVLTKNGSILKLCGADDDAEVDKLRGFRIDGLGIDEAAYHKAARLAYIIQEAIGPRLRGWIMLVGTPGHDPSGLFYDATAPGGKLHRPYADRDLPEYDGWRAWSSHFWTLKQAQEWARSRGLVDSELYDVWDHALEEKETEQWTDDNPKWRREYLGEWAKDNTNNMYKYRATVVPEGATEPVDWNRWDPERIGPLKVAKLPEDRTDWMWVVSLDRGHADEFAINGFAFSPSDPKKRIYHVLCYERKRLYARWVACLLLGTKAKGDLDAVMAGPGEDGKDPPNPRAVDDPDPLSPYGILGHPIGGVCDSDMTLIDEFRRSYGIRCVQAKRTHEEKTGAIELVNGDLVDGRMKVLVGSALETQMLNLQWEVDEFERLREPKGKPDHSADCVCGGRKLIAHLFESGQVGEADAKKKPDPRRRVDPDDESDDAPETPAWLADKPEWLSALAQPDSFDPHEDAWP